MEADFAHHTWRLQAKKITIFVADFLKNVLSAGYTNVSVYRGVFYVRDNIMQQKVTFFLLKNLTKSDRAGMDWPFASGTLFAAIGWQWLLRH